MKGNYHCKSERIVIKEIFSFIKSLLNFIVFCYNPIIIHLYAKIYIIILYQK